MDQQLTNFIKYCLGYIKLTQKHSFLNQQKYSVNITEENFNLVGLLNGDTDGELGELINLKVYYMYDPLDVPQELVKEYIKEKSLANKIEEIYSKFRNDQFTKQIILNFGYFEIEIPKEETTFIEDENEQDITKIKESLYKQDSLFNESSEKIDSTEENTKQKYPLFSLPINIEKDQEKYILYSVDPDIQVNIGVLEELLGSDLYFQLVEKLGRYEVEGKLTLPYNDDKILNEIWLLVKKQLKLKNINFNDDSFNLNEIRIALGSRVNYFLAEDLRNLTDIDQNLLSESSLTSWIENGELNIQSEIPVEKELYFPFLYDKYKLQVLSVVNNKAAIVQGPPGTGKSETIANLLCHFAATGKRVLFVSQKAQALKVVKDKLKKLEIKYLYGYIPNPSSQQLTEQDEIDGVAPQLAGLSSYIQNIGFRVNRYNNSDEDLGTKQGIDNIVEERDVLKSSLNSGIEIEREIWKLQSKINTLKEYSFTIESINKFEANFTQESFNKLVEIEQKLQYLQDELNRYETNPTKKTLDNKFLSLDLDRYSYLNEIKIIKEDVKKTGFDRHSKVLRSINNSLRKLRLSKHVTALPREIIDHIDEVLNKDISRSDSVKHIEILHLHLEYFDFRKQISLLQEEYNNLLTTSGLQQSQFNIIKKLQNKYKDINEIKESIVSLSKLQLSINELLDKTHNYNDISEQINKVEYLRSKNISIYIQNIINESLIEYWKQGVTIKQIINKLGKAFGQSKRAFKTFDTLRRDPNNFKTILDVIPIWIMELDDASRIVPLEASLFDYVILDEASQCNIAYTLPAMFRAKKALFVGDSQQMRDTTVMFKSNRAFDDLARRYQIKEDLQIKATNMTVQSVLEIAKARGFTPIPLKYHYRSPNELIGFSNEYFYKPNGQQLVALNNNYLTYKDTNRVMLIHKITSDWQDEISDNVNVAEAEAILKFFKNLRTDDTYKDKSIGILSFFNAQATYIRELFEKAGFNEDDDNYKVSIIDGIQGDEKDIILYSFVIRNQEQKNKYIPLTGENGDLRKEINNGRVNVAFSRARLQVHCFVSMNTSEIPDNIWLKKYLQYVENHGEIDFYTKELKAFDSYFEKEFYNIAKTNLKKHYLIQNQVTSCGFRIDFVISNPKTGKRIAIECDGPTHFANEIDEEYGVYIESDEERQNVLESAGWKFYRIKYSDWIKQNVNKLDYLKEIVNILD